MECTLKVALVVLSFALVFTSVAGENRGHKHEHGGWGDPQFRGLDGRVFYFDGLVGKIFNLISEQDHQLNAEFSLGPHKIDALGAQSNGTFMTAFGLQMYDNKVEMHTDEEGSITIVVNGEDSAPSLTEAESFRKVYQDSSHDVTITVERYRTGTGHSVSVRSSLMELIMYGTMKQFDPVVNEIARAHLNFEMGVNPEALSMTVMHGVMGQNTNTRMSPNTIIPDELSTVFLGDGEDQDYIVSSLFSNDFKYNKYGAEHIIKGGSGTQGPLTRSHSLKMGASRRHLREGEATFAPFAKIGGLL